MLLREVVEAPELHLRLLHGRTEALERPVRWTYSSDLLDPSRYLDGEELVISGLVWRRSPSDSETFVTNIASAGAMALAAGEAQFGCVPDDVVEACRRHDLVLVGVPEDVSFTLITEKIIGADAAERGARMEATIVRQRQMLSSLAEGKPLTELVDALSSETGIACRLLTATGREVIAAGEPLTADVLEKITREFLTAPQLPTVARVHGSDCTPHAGSRPGSDPGSDAFSLFAVGSTLGSRLSMWMVAAEGDLSQWPTASRDSIIELAAIAQLERSRIEERRRIVRSIADDALRLVINGAASHPETHVRLRQAGLEVDDQVVVVVSRILGSAHDEEGRAVVEEALTGVHGAMVAQAPEGEAVALIPCPEPGRVDDLRRTMVLLGPGLARRRLGVGISEPAYLSGLTGMWEEARHAQQLAALGEEPVSIVTGNEITSHVLLLATVPDHIRRLFVSRVLGSVEAYDAVNDAGLLRTLECFLRHAGSWQRASQELHLHVNSVRYRIARIEKLTGRDLSRLQDRVDVFLALRLLQTTGGPTTRRRRG